MRKFLGVIILLSVLITLFVNKLTYGQIIIDPFVSSLEMVNNLTGYGINASNISYTGSDSAKAMYYTNGFTDIELKEGICLSTGRIKYAAGPNLINENLSFSNGKLGDFLLSSLIQMTYTWDAAILEFDFIPTKSLITISFFFSSEEYPEWADVNKDLIGIFLTGPNPYGPNYSNTNIATIPNTNLPICVLNINNVIPSFEEYYIDNTTGQYFAYDGLTKVFSPFINVIANSVYHVKIGIADANDIYYDSGLFIEQGSLKSIDSTDFTRYRFKAVLNQNLTQDVLGIINNDTAKLFVPYLTDITQIISSFTVPSGTLSYIENVLQISDTSINDFSEPVIYSLIAANGESKDWTVVVNFLPNSENEILEYNFLVENNPNLPWDISCEIVENAITADVPIGTDLSSLIATFTLSDYATAFVNGIPQQSGVTANNFYNAVNYQIEAENGDINNYSVSVIMTGTQIISINSGFFIYPNPATEHIIVTIDNALNEESFVSIFDIKGQQVIQHNFQNHKRIEIDVSNLPKGFYLMKILTKEGMEVKKVVIQ